MPFSESLNDVYEFLIKGALSEAGFDVKRADDIKSQSNILEDIVKGIIESKLIVADLTDSNANVYYELGIAHALQKNVVLITQDIDELPFDLRSYRVIAYSTHFTRMNEAKSELKNIAIEALAGTLPFGNPVKDYGNLKIQSDILSSDVETQNNEEQSEFGLLDHIVEVEESFEELSDIIEIVSTKLIDELTPEITNSTDQLTNTSSISAKQKRNVIKKLAGYVDEYGNFLKPKNESYKSLIKKVETSIETIFTDNFIDIDEESIEGASSFINGFKSLEEAAQQARNGYISMLETMKNLPNMERSFNRASKHMQQQLEIFVENIDQTISMSSRALTLGKSLLSKVAENQN